MAERTIRFGIIGLDHRHVYIHVRMLLGAGAEFVAYYSDKPELVADFVTSYPDVRAAKSMEEILEDPTIDIIAGAAMPFERANISIKAMQHGKDVITDKPAVTSLEQLDEIRRVQRETERIWCLYSNEHHERRCTVLAGELVAQGAIGRVIQTTGIGPHSISNTPVRPAWFFDRALSGGIIGDIGAHQIEQFLFFTGSRIATVVHAQTGNFANRDHPEFEDYGEVALVGDGGVGWFRVDWCSTPASLPASGDIRLFLVGTEGYMEMRKYIDPDGRPGSEHLLVVNKDGPRFIDTTNVPLTFGPRFLNDVRNRTETAIPQERSFLVSRLSMEAKLATRSIDTRAHLNGGPQAT